MKPFKFFSLPVFLLGGSLFVHAQINDPKANPSAVVTLSEVRFTVLTPQLFRLEWSKKGEFEDKASLVFINRNLPAPKFIVDDKTDWLTITTEKLTLRYKKGSGKFTSDNLLVSFSLNGRAVTWHPGMEDPLNLKGTTRTLDGANGEKDVNLEQGLVSRSGWSLIDDSEKPLFDGSEWDWVAARPSGERQDWYFLGYGHEYKKALNDFTLLAGKIPMPPRFAFGYWWSRYWTYSDSELRTLIADMRRYDVPIDVLIIDMDWHETYGLSVHGTKIDPFGQAVGWTGYTWNRGLFPDPERFLKWTKEKNLKTALNLHPASGIAPMEEKYTEFAKVFGFDTMGHQYIPFKIEDKKWTKTYFDVVLHPLEKQGIDFWWIDWQAWRENKVLKELSNTWWLNHTFFTDMERQGKQRPLLFHRWGGLGNHRYQIGFSGDTWSTWDALAYQPYFTATAANVGYGYWSHDIGGHVGNDPDPELYLRWIQWGIFSPVLRTHSTKSSLIERRIWKYNDHFEMMRDAFHLRYQLVPYIYTASRKAYDAGVSICRPMYYDYPEKEEAYEFKGQYMFGDDMLVAPIAEKAATNSGLVTKKVWLPTGDWYEWFTGTVLKGGSVVERRFALNEIPLYVKAGALVPMNPKTTNLQRNIDTLIIACIPNADGETKVYEDDGTTSAYKNSQYAYTTISRKYAKDGSQTVTIFPIENVYKNIPKRRAYELCFPASVPPSEVVVSGKVYPYSTEMSAGHWTYEGPKLTTHVLTDVMPRDKKTEIVLHYPEGYDENSKILNGMVGVFSRLPRIVQMMKDEVNRHDQIANAPPLVLKAGSLPTRINYQPQKTVDYLQEFHAEYGALLRQVTNYARGDATVLEAIVNQFPFESKIVPRPTIHLEKKTSDQPVKVEIVGVGDAEIRYTLDGSIPDAASPLYAGPITLTKTSTVKAKSFKQGYLESLPSTDSFQLVFAKSVQYEFSSSSRYTGGGEFALVNGKFGTADDYRNDWVAFQQVDFSATIELVKPRDISSVTTRFLQNQPSWIFLPTHLECEVSSDGVRYEKVFERDTRNEAEKKSDGVEIHSYTANMVAHNISHIRVRAKNISVCPEWHSGAGGKAWLFTDEIIVE